MYLSSTLLVTEHYSINRDIYFTVTHTDGSDEGTLKISPTCASISKYVIVHQKSGAKQITHTYIIHTIRTGAILKTTTLLNSLANNY